MTTLRVLSWNIWGGKNLDEIIECLKEANADIIALQEVLQDVNGNNNGAKTIAEALGYHWVFGRTRTLDPDVSHLLKEHGIQTDKEWGNAVLSKWPISDHEVLFLSEKNQRTAVLAKINIYNTEISVFSTHLVHAAHPTEVRIAQAEYLLKNIPKAKAIIGGDFNDTPESETIVKMETAMKRGEDTTSTNDSRKIDYIFTTGDFEILEEGSIASLASDHLPIYSVIRF